VPGVGRHGSHRTFRNRLGRERAEFTVVSRDLANGAAINSRSITLLELTLRPMEIGTRQDQLRLGRRLLVVMPARAREDAGSVREPSHRVVEASGGSWVRVIKGIRLGSSERLYDEAALAFVGLFNERAGVLGESKAVGQVTPKQSESFRAQSECRCARR
jgi:hypothetical protein